MDVLYSEWRISFITKWEKAILHLTIWDTEVLEATVCHFIKNDKSFQSVRRIKDIQLQLKHLFVGTEFGCKDRTFSCLVIKAP